MDLVRINRAALPSEEHEAAGFIEHNLMMLQLNAQDFRSSADLYLYAHARKMAGLPPYSSSRMIAWMRTAGRSGAIAAGSFAMIMQIIGRAKAPSIRAAMNKDAKEAATKLFAAEFPNVSNVRNSTAHPGELSGHRDERGNHGLAKTAVLGGAVYGQGSFVLDSMNAFDDRLILGATFKKRPVEYELSMRKADALDQVAHHYCAAFYPLEDSISAWQRATRR